jgi:hypothetical protein
VASPEELIQQRREELIQQRREELLGEGYSPGVVNLAIEWAEKSAEGSSDYFQQPADLFLPRYLLDTEKYLKGLGAQLDTARLTPRAGGLDGPQGTAP